MLARLMRSLLLIPLALLSCTSDEPVSGVPTSEIDSGAIDSDEIDSGIGDSVVDAIADTTVVSDSAPSETLSEKTVVRVHYPAAGKTISVRGSVAPWSWEKGIALKASGDTWTLEATLTADAELKPLLDDTTWSRGPNYKVKVGQTIDIYPHFTTVKGKFEKRWPTFASTALGNTRGVYVYYPPVYLENSTVKLPVVYMHDGQNLFDAATAFGGSEWKVDETMDVASEDGSIREAIIVGPENTSGRMFEYTPTKDAEYPSGGGGDKYLAMLVDELKPKVDTELRTLPGRETTAVLGSSLGGLISAYAGVQKPKTFGLIGAMSPSTFWDNKAILKIVAASTDKPLRVYVDSGDSGPSADDNANTKLLADTYRSIGFVDDVTLRYVVQPGATHTEVYWAQRLPGALKFLLGAGR